MTNELKCPNCHAEVESTGISHSVGNQPLTQVQSCANCDTPLRRFPDDEGAIGRGWKIDEVRLGACPHCGNQVDGDFTRSGPNVKRDGVITPSQHQTTNCDSCGRPVSRWVWPGQPWRKAPGEAPEIRVIG